jgi:hypothetical protein
VSAYVGRLIARAHGRLPVVRPRLPSRFEPAPGLAADFGAIPTVDEEAPVEPAAPGRTAAVEIAPATRPMALEASNGRRQGTPAPTATPPLFAEAPPIATASKALPAPPEAQADMPVSEAAAPIALPPTPPRAAMAPFPAVPREVGQAAPYAIAAGEEPAVASVALAAASLPERGQRTEPSRRAPSEGGDTVVHVTIGRVDVRAIVTEPAKPAPRPQRPRRSLDDYLAGMRR